MNLKPPSIDLDSKNIILNIQNLKVRFETQDGTIHAVNGVSFNVFQGETLGIVGESGCGKSASVLSIMRLLPEPPAKISYDEAKFLDIDLAQKSNRELREIRGRKIAMIFQDPMTSLNPVFTIGFQISEPLMLHLGFNKNQARKRAEELLDMMGIPDAAARLDNYPHQFSGGMRQRILIAIALTCNPTLLIADEPTTALDVTIQAQIVDLVKKLRDQMGMSMIWITHDLGVLAGLADRIVVMYAGFIVEEASVFELYANPKHPYTRSLLRALPTLDGNPCDKLEAIEGLPPDIFSPPRGCPYAARCRLAVEICFEEHPKTRSVAVNHNIACWVDIS